MAEEETQRALRRPLARKEKVSGVERAKRASRHLRGGLRDSLGDVEPGLSETDRRVAKFHVILGQFLLKDWTVLKVMATAVAVGAIGVYALVAAGQASLHVKPALLGGVVLGGVLFGVGMTVFGYCPGTGVAACGEGRRDAMVGVLGMLIGAGAFVALYPQLQPLIHGLGDWGTITVPEVLGVSPWAVIAGLIVVGGLALWLMGRGEGAGGRPELSYGTGRDDERAAETAGAGTVRQ